MNQQLFEGFLGELRRIRSGYLGTRVTLVRLNLINGTSITGVIDYVDECGVVKVDVYDNISRLDEKSNWQGEFDKRRKKEKRIIRVDAISDFYEETELDNCQGPQPEAYFLQG